MRVAGRRRPRGRPDERVRRAVGDHQARRRTRPPAAAPSTLGYDQPNSGRLMVQSLTARAAPSRRRTSATRWPAPPPARRLQPIRRLHDPGHRSSARSHRGGIAPRGRPDAQRANELSVATYNVENLDPTDPQAKFDRLAAGHRHQPQQPGHRRPGGDPGQQRRRPTTARSPPTRRSPSSPRRSWPRAARATSGARSTRSNDADGGEPGGNIRVGVPVQPGAGDLRRPAGRRRRRRAVGGRGREHGRPRLSVSPGRIDPPSAAWTNSRKPLAGEFVFHGKHGVRRRQPLQLQGRRPAAARPVPAAGAQLEVQRAAAGDGGARLRRPGLQAVDADANIVVARRHQRLRVLPDGRPR